MKSLIPWVCLAATAGANGAFAENGVDAYRQGHYMKAAEQLANPTAKDPIVDYYMGRMRLYGYGELKNNISAMRYFQHAAEKGFLPAQRILALHALLNEHNPEQALYWFKKAADANDIDAQLYCAAAYLFGVGTKKNSELAKRYYIPAARSGDALAQVTLAEDFLDSRHAANKKLGFIWLNKAVEQHNPEAQLKLAKLYASGTVVPVDLAKAKELISLSVAQGYLPAISQMGELARQQNDLQQAKEWFSKAAMSHYGPAEMGLSRLYMQEKTPLYDPHLGFLWMLKAAQNGYTEAQLAIADMYKKGQGVDADENLAKEWLQKAKVAVKDTPATAEAKAAQWLSLGKTTHLAATRYHLRGILSNWKNPEALKQNIYNQSPRMATVNRKALYQPKFAMMNPNEIPISEYYDVLATVLGGSSAKNTLVLPRYPLEKPALSADAQSVSDVPKVGNSPTPEDAALIARLQARAVLGDTSAQFALGQMYQDGIGTAKDVSLAIKQYELASAQQDLRSEYNLALLYLEGQGIPADYQKALTLLRDAAFKGNDHAQYVLARLNELGYRNATGEVVIPPNPEEAMVMYDLAAANDFGLAQYHLAEMLVREKKTDMTVAAKEQRSHLIKTLYQDAFATGIQEAALPLAYFNAMDKSANKQAQALEVAKKGAKSDEPGAALLLGLLYDRGIAVTADPAEALHWYEKAPNNAVTAFILGTYYSQGLGVSKDQEKGKSLLQQAADAGFSYADFNLAVMQQQAGNAFLPELNKALASGNSAAGLLLADYYLSLANNNEEMQQAHDIYQRLAEKGDKDAQLKLGFMLDKGLGGPVDAVAAEKWYSQAAEQGQVVAQYLLGHLYQLGLPGALPDDALAKKWYSAAASTYTPAAIALGFIYDTVDDDYVHALSQYQAAADKQDPIGQFNLGLIYEQGKGRAVDFVKAKELYQAAADAGLHQAMVSLAGLYFNGQGVDRDEEKAFELYKKAAALGDRDALYQLGLLSETGVATKLDFTEALHYYEQASMKGNAKATLALARIYQFGLGVTIDKQKALNYYKALAAQGNAYAEYQLALFYYEGLDGKPMPQQAKQWLQQAQLDGSLQARRMTQWLAAHSPARGSFIEPVMMNSTAAAGEQPAELMYFDALNDWNRGDERSSWNILSRLMTQFPDYEPAKRAYEQLSQQSLSLGNIS